MGRVLLSVLVGVVACQKLPELPQPQGWQYQDSSRASFQDVLPAIFDGEAADSGSPPAEEEVRAPLLGQFDVRSPAPGGVAFSDPLVLDLRYSRPFNQDYVVRLDGQRIEAPLRAGPLKDQWTLPLPTLNAGTHRLAFVSRANPDKVFESSFAYQTSSPLERVVALADASVRRFKPEKLAWDWREGLFLYALLRLDARLGESRYRPFAEVYFAHQSRNGIPKVNWSDKCVPGLAAFELYKATGNPAYLAITQRVIDYLKEAKPTKVGGLNHFGTNTYSWVYPDSMWVDSLMMYNVLAARFGQNQGDWRMQAFAVEQAAAFARVLQNPTQRLWKHAYLTNWERPIPKTDTYWLRGNGWALASLAETLALMPADRPEMAGLKAVFQSTADALLGYQSETGLWTTVLNRPDATYLESSGTALVAYGLLAGYQQGLLGETARQAGEKAYLGLLGRLQETAGGPSMPEISHHTMPYSFLGYSLVPQRSDLPHGLAALILAGVADADLTRP